MFGNLDRSVRRHFRADNNIIIEAAIAIGTWHSTANFNHEVISQVWEYALRMNENLRSPYNAMAC